MTLIDHGKERQRLAAIYADKSELELAGLAEDQRELTEDALVALESEFSKRGLPFERQDLSIADEPEVKLIALRRFRDLPQALVAKGVLDSAGVKCFLADENAVRMTGFDLMFGGVGLWVREDDLPEAATLLSPEFSPEAATQFSPTSSNDTDATEPEK